MHRKPVHPARRFLTVLLAFVVLSLSGIGALVIADAATAAPIAVETIEEDDPRWDCSTMGNGICGGDPSVPDYTPLPDGGFMVGCGSYSALIESPDGRLFCTPV